MKDLISFIKTKYEVEELNEGSFLIKTNEGNFIIKKDVFTNKYNPLCFIKDKEKNRRNINIYESPDKIINNDLDPFNNKINKNKDITGMYFNKKDIKKTFERFEDDSSDENSNLINKEILDPFGNKLNPDPDHFDPKNI